MQFVGWNNLDTLHVSGLARLQEQVKAASREDLLRSIGWLRERSLTELSEVKRSGPTKFKSLLNGQNHAISVYIMYIGQ